MTDTSSDSSQWPTGPDRSSETERPLQFRLDNKQDSLQPNPNVNPQRQSSSRPQQSSSRSPHRPSGTPQKQSRYMLPRSPPAPAPSPPKPGPASAHTLSNIPTCYKYVAQSDVIDRVARGTATAQEQRDFSAECGLDGAYRQLALSQLGRYRAQVRERGASAQAVEAARGRMRRLERALDEIGALNKRVIRLGVPPFSPPMSL